jgi:hypothetical protein
MSTPAQPYYPQVDKSVDPKVTVHIQRIYPWLNNNDRAIVLLNSKVAALQKTAAAATTTTTSTTSSSSSSSGGSTNNFTGLGTTNNQEAATSYTLQQTDSGALIVVNDASPVAISLNSVITSPFLCFITNLGAGLCTLTPTTGTVNGSASFPLPQNYTAIVVYSASLWWATALPVVPQNTPAVAHEWINAYNANSGTFSQTQPAFTDLSGNLATSQLPTAGLSVTITTAALTGGGTQGSMIFTNGILTAQVQAT